MWVKAKQPEGFNVAAINLGLYPLLYFADGEYWVFDHILQASIHIDRTENDRISRYLSQ